MEEGKKIRRYIETYIPVSACNMKCTYCYLDEDRNRKINKLKWSPEHIRKALSKKRLGGACLINLCAAGETMLLPDFDMLVFQLVQEGHYISIVTNGTFEPAFEKMAQFSREIWEHLFFKFSLHYFELQRLDKFEVFWKHVNLVKEKGGAFTIELTPDDKYIPIQDDIYNMCLEHVGAACHISIPRDDTKPEKPIFSQNSLKQLSEIWSRFDSSLFKFKEEIWGVQRNEFCYAGDWSFLLDFNDGTIRACYESKEIIQNIMDDVDKPINFCAVGTCCPSCHCYNGHAFLSLGVIPELDAPTYAVLRDRNEQWLNNTIRDVFSTKLNETNGEYSDFRKRNNNLMKYVNKVKKKIFRE